MGKNILITYFLICIFMMSAKSFAASTGILSTSPVTGVTVEAVKNPWDQFSTDPGWKIDFSKTSGNNFACMVGYAFRVNCITKDPTLLPPKNTYLKCRVESDLVENYWAVMYYQYINEEQPPYDNVIWGYMTSDYHDYSQIRDALTDDPYEIRVRPKIGGSIVVVYQGVPEVGMPEAGIDPGQYPPSQYYMYNILIRYPNSSTHRDRAKFQVGYPHSWNPNDDAYGYNMAKAFYIETTYDNPYVSSLLNVSQSGVYTSPPSSHKPWWWNYLHPPGLSVSETISQNDSQTGPVVMKDTPKKDDRGFIQCGFARILTDDNTETAFVCKTKAMSDTNEYIRPPLNTADLPEVDGNTVTVTTSIGDVNIEYQYCLYYDRYNQLDPCSDPNQIMDWVVEKVNKVVTMPHVDTSCFLWGDYYVMQWKIKFPPNCEAVDSFTIWQPNYVGIFMKKYAESNGIVYYVSNPLLPTRYQEMAGTYIGTEDIYSLLPQDPVNEDEITIYYDGYYHPYDITQDGIINLEDFAVLAKDYRSSSEHDLTGDGIIDIDDIRLLLNYYLDDSRWGSFLTVYPKGDFNHDNKVNFIDFARLGDLWHNGTPAETDIENLKALCDNWLYRTN